MRIIIPPLKSQGIKTKLVPWIRALVPTIAGRWIEPFFGTGVVAFNVGAKKALLGDINPHIIKFYQEIQTGKITPKIVREYLKHEGGRLESSPEGGYAYFRQVRERFNKKFEPLDLLFLSRAGFNGMMRFNRSGKWNIPFCQKPNRFSQAYITKIVNQVEDVASIIQPSWQFIVADFSELITQANKDDVIYCDPPYIGRYVDFYSGWSEEDEQRLFTLLSNTPAKFILSTWHHNEFRRNPFFDLFWKQFNVVTRDHFYYSGARIENRRKVVEALVFNFPVTIQKHNHGLGRLERQKHLFEALVEDKK